MERSAGGRTPGGSPAVGRPTILVVEDEILTRQTLTDLLEAHDYRVVTAGESDEVFARLGEVDLVLLDAMLPGRDGWDICREIKETIDPLLPIIMVTARTAPEDVIRTFEAGADDYVPKPFQVAELTARIESRLRAHRTERALQQANLQASELADQNYRLYQQARRDAEERATLLRELDHRVRNNLSVILGLISMERNRNPLRDAADALAALENRLRTFLVVYEALRRSSYRGVPFRQIAERLAQKLRNSLDPEGRIRLQVVGDEVALGERQAFALSLALNELITNALQHAFPGERGGTLRIGIRTLDDSVQVRVQDDGVGFTVPESPGAGGRAFVDALVRTELGGQVSYDTGVHGSLVSFSCPIHPIDEQPAEEDVPRERATVA